MAKSKSSFERQNQIIAQFARDARSKDTNSAVQQAIRATKKAKKLFAKNPKIEQPRFIFGSPAHLEFLKQQKQLKSNQTK